MNAENETQLFWETSTGYDFFISITVLHKPNKWALRGAWAKGVRARLPTEARDFFEETYDLFFSPLPWVYGLPAPRDGAAVLNAIAALPAGDRLRVLTKEPEMPAEVLDLLLEVADRGSWGSADREVLWSTMKNEQYEPPLDQLTRLLDWWSRSEEFGEQLLAALRSYYDVFFAEDEERIRPALRQVVERGQELARERSLSELMEALSEGVVFESVPEKPEMVMAPSFWIAPLIVLSEVSASCGLFIFGGRPEDASLVPGEVVPDALYRTLKALADPTRLRILRYLEIEPLAPSDLARRLRLRAPTVIHHLNTLRLAGLVTVTFGGKGDKRYAARTNRVDEITVQMRAFLRGGRAEAEVPSGIRELSEQPRTVA